MKTEIVSIIIAAISALLGWIFGTRSERSARQQYRLDAISFAGSWYSDLREWASEAILLMSEAAERCEQEGNAHHENTEALMSCRYRLSALIDRGRFFLPNELHHRYGLQKPEAYRGVRHPAIDYLVGAYQIIDGSISVEESGFDSKERALVELKRQFVSAIQVVIDPRQHTQEISHLVEASRKETLEKASSLDQFVNKILRAKIKL